VGLGGAAWASIPSADRTVDAFFSMSGGNLTVVDAGVTKCGTNRRRWSDIYDADGTSTASAFSLAVCC
jgi:hypothetical protein